MERKTYIMNALEIAGAKAKYDAQVKKILADKVILAWILKYTAAEFMQYGISEIADAIEGEPEISNIPVYPGKAKTEAVTGMPTEDNIPNEGEITYDIRFYAVTKSKKRVKLIINVEAQKKYHPGYDLIPRGIFYCARMLSAQLDTEFTTGFYDDMKKVYSIWICMDTPKKAENTITEYRMEQKKVFGDFKGEARYDLLSVVMVCLGRDEERAEGSRLHHLLATALSEKISVREKEETLHDLYGIKTSVEMKEGMRQMCNLSDLIEERAITRGMEKGLQQGIEKGIERGIEKGIEKGKAEGEQRVNRLVQILIEMSRTDEISKMVSDREYQKKLFKEFGL